MSEWKRSDTLADRLRAVIAERGMTQSELARRSGLSASYITYLLSGQRGKRIGRHAASRLKRALRVPDAFFDTSRLHMGNDTRGH